MCYEVMQLGERGTQCSQTELWRVSRWAIIRAQRLTKSAVVILLQVNVEAVHVCTVTQPVALSGTSVQYWDLLQHNSCEVVLRLGGSN